MAAFLAIAPNGFFRFTKTSGSNDGQDEWRATNRLTINYGVRWEVNPPFTEVQDRLNTFVPGQQSTVFPNAPLGVLFPGDIAAIQWTAFMPRIGFAWNPDGRGTFARSDV